MMFSWTILPKTGKLWFKYSIQLCLFPECIHSDNYPCFMGPTGFPAVAEFCLLVILCDRFPPRSHLAILQVRTLQFLSGLCVCVLSVHFLKFTDCFSLRNSRDVTSWPVERRKLHQERKNVTGFELRKVKLCTTVKPYVHNVTFEVYTN